jgi:DNA invertase Pin-like site-specific DNA recombinase
MKYIGYYRVSTQKQGKSGLGLDAQKKMVADFVAINGGEIVAEYTEIESGKRDDRPELMKAMKHADMISGKLLVGKLDRLSRDLHFITSLQKSRVDFVVSDMPNCDSFSIHIYGAMAQKEREMISARTKAGLAAAKAKGKKLGTNNLNMELVKEASAKGVRTRVQIAFDNAHKVVMTIRSMRSQGKSLRAVAAELNKMGVPTPRGCEWTATAIKNAMETVEKGL